MAEGVEATQFYYCCQTRLHIPIAYPYSQMKSRSRIICQDTADPSEEEEGGVVGGGVGGVGGEAGVAGVSCR
jgi:hypothetical protein